MDLKTLLEFGKFVAPIKSWYEKQNETSLVANLAVQIFHNSTETQPKIADCCLKAKEFVNAAKTIVGA